MRDRSRQGVILLLACALAGVAPACGTAADLLVMPFTCAVVGGEPVLTPARELGHRIVGAREQRMFSACSPVNPNVCRQWTLHRFDVDCGGVRVPWASVAAAADRNGRAWVEDGRLRIRMGPWWNAAPGDPCAGMPLHEDRWQPGGLSRYCAERNARMPPAVVEMPAGFSPMLGTRAIIVSGSAAPAPATGYAPFVSAAPPSPPAPADARPRPRPAQSAREPNAAEAPASPKQMKQVEAPALASPPPPSETAPTPGTPKAPRILNPDAQASAQPATPPSVAPESPAPVAPSPPPREQAIAANPPAPPAQDDLIVAHLVSAAVDPTTIVLSGLLACLMGGVAMFAWLRHRERTQFARATTRDFASVPLEGAHDELPVARSLVVGHLATSPALHPPSAFGGGVSPVLGEAIPRTRADALRVLGLGVTPDATEIAIKKIVDGLRLSWHPDYAKDAEDRRIREIRVKQINAAWEIIGLKRAQA
jgi:hypothetical protein